MFILYIFLHNIFIWNFISHIDKKVINFSFTKLNFHNKSYFELQKKKNIKLILDLYQNLIKRIKKKVIKLFFYLGTYFI